MTAVAVRFVEPAKAPEPRGPSSLTEIEAVFEIWGEHAVWSGDTTEYRDPMLMTEP